MGKARWACLAMLVTWLLPSARALGHGDVHARIAELSEQIVQQPQNAALYARRGSLYVLDESWEQALTDFETAVEIDPSSPEIDVLRAKVLVELEQDERALVLLDSFLSAEPGHADGHLVRARANVALGRIDAAVQDYGRAIVLFERPAPYHYVERARALLGAGRVDEALAGLRQAVADLGPLASLVELAVAQEEKRGRYEEALQWANQLSPTLRHSPRWRAIAANLAGRAGRASLAEHEYREGLAAIDALPPARRGPNAMTELRNELAAGLEAQMSSSGAHAASKLGTGSVRKALALGVIVVALCLRLVRRKRRRV